jgi:hypothetical protein
MLPIETFGNTVKTGPSSSPRWYKYTKPRVNRKHPIPVYLLPAEGPPSPFSLRAQHQFRRAGNDDGIIDPVSGFCAGAGTR